MKKFEYAIDFIDESQEHEIKAFLNKWGEQGWEFVHMSVRPYSANLYFFKRELGLTEPMVAASYEKKRDSDFSYTISETETDKGFLKWIHNRLLNVHDEPDAVDFMTRLREIINSLWDVNS